MRTFRGQMGLSEEEQIKLQELRLHVNGGAGVDNSKEVTQRQVDEALTMSGKCEIVASGCCQQNGSSSCCHNAVLPEKDSLDANERTKKATLEKKKSSKKLLSRINSSKRLSTRKLCAMPTCFENWEREDTYAVLAVTCAIVSVAVAYNCYRQL